MSGRTSNLPPFPEDNPTKEFHDFLTYLDINPLALLAAGIMAETPGTPFGPITLSSELVRRQGGIPQGEWKPDGVVVKRYRKNNLYPANVVTSLRGPLLPSQLCIDSAPQRCTLLEWQAKASELPIAKLLGYGTPDFRGVSNPYRRYYLFSMLLRHGGATAPASRVKQAMWNDLCASRSVVDNLVTALASTRILDAAKNSKGGIASVAIKPELTPLIADLIERLDNLRMGRRIQKYRDESKRILHDKPTLRTITATHGAYTRARAHNSAATTKNLILATGRALGDCTAQDIIDALADDPSAPRTKQMVHIYLRQFALSGQVYIDTADTRSRRVPNRYHFMSPEIE